MVCGYGCVVISVGCGVVIGIMFLLEQEGEEELMLLRKQKEVRLYMHTRVYVCVHYCIPILGI